MICRESVRRRALERKVLWHADHRRTGRTDRLGSEKQIASRMKTPLAADLFVQSSALFLTEESSQC